MGIDFRVGFTVQFALIAIVATASTFGHSLLIPVTVAFNVERTSFRSHGCAGRRSTPSPAWLACSAPSLRR